MAKKLERENLLNKKIKKFNFVQKLGSGSYGTVYKALNTKTNQIVAIKVLSKSEIKEQPKLQKLVASQIEILKQVKNQNVIRFVDSFSTDQSIFIATQFCNGGDLQKYCKQCGKLDQNQAVTFLKQILNGFKGLHEKDTMHRDFKLANVLLHDNVCKIADLGFAKQIRDKALTTTLLGTDETMAPEVHQNKQYGWSADIWSLGVVFYQMLYGRLPYPGFNDHEIFRKIKMTKPNFSDVDVSQQAIDFIKQCLVIDPAKRITWKQIYNHPLLYKSDITLTKALLRSRISFQGHKTYYEKNQQNKRKNKRQEETIQTSRQKQIFKNAGQIENADIKAESIKKNKQQLQAQFAQYETDIIHTRNNKMFGITQVLPLQKQFLEISSVNHQLPLYQISKNCYIEIKHFRQEVHGDGFRQKFKFWKQFKQQSIYQQICQQLLKDQIFAESLTVGYKWGLGDHQDNMNRKTAQAEYKKIIENYKNQLTPHIKDQSRKSKVKYIKMIKALQKMVEQPSFNLQEFQRMTDNIDVSKQEKILLKK